MVGQCKSHHVVVVLVVVGNAKQKNLYECVMVSKLLIVSQSLLSSPWMVVVLSSDCVENLTFLCSVYVYNRFHVSTAFLQ